MGLHRKNCSDMSHSLIKWKINEQNYKLQNCHLKKLNEKFWVASSLELIMCYPCLIVIPPYTFGFTWTLPRRRKPTKLFKTALFCYYPARKTTFVLCWTYIRWPVLTSYSWRSTFIICVSNLLPYGSQLFSLLNRSLLHWGETGEAKVLISYNERDEG